MVTQGAVVQVGKFGLVGVFNTLIDFSIFNLLTGKRFKLGKIPANICSTTTAMLFSFFAQREAVFMAGSGNPVMQAVLFFVTTGFGLYVLQSGVLYLLLHRWGWPTEFVNWFLQTTGLKRRFSTDLVLRNSSKATGTAVSLVWNFFMYKYVVFR